MHESAGLCNQEHCNPLFIATHSGGVTWAGTGPWGGERPPELARGLQSIAIVYAGGMRLVIIFLKKFKKKAG